MLATDRPNGLNTPAHPGRVIPATLCVHFTGRGVEHCIWFAEPAPPHEVLRARAARLAAEWEVGAGPLLLGRARLRGEVACDGYLLTGADAQLGERRAGTTAEDRDLLRSQGLTRDRATLLARMPDRPLLATVARGPALSPQLLRRIHCLLLADPHRIG